MNDPKKIMKAAYYIDMGLSLKDALSDEEISQAVSMLADVLLCTGEPPFDPEEVE